MTPDTSRRLGELSQYLDPDDQVRLMRLVTRGEVVSFDDVPDSIVEKARKSGFSN